MKIVFCSAEVAPFSQAGGLGDVMGSLPRALSALGLDCTILTPRYGLIDPEEHGLEKLDLRYEVEHDGCLYLAELWKGTLPRSDVPVYFIDNEALFGRNEVYPFGQPEVELNGFLFFSKAVFEAIRHLEVQADILHVHDWHTAAIPKFLAEKRQAGEPAFVDTRSVLTIHNLNYQGVYGDMNWLREGIVHADAVTTVSPNYAQEIQTPEFGAGLDGVMRACSQKVSGILNGIDTTLYNPETDAFLTRHYNAETFAEGKALCKEALQMELGLPRDPAVPLIGFVGRLAAQKGLDLLIPAMEQVTDGSVQWAMIGSGDPAMEARLRELNGRFSHTRSYIGFNASMAQRIYAGADLFAMPSRFEPCGLGQMIALRYGTVPVVRGVGGLVDTIIDVREHPESGNGFVFHEYSPEALKQALQAAVSLYRQKDCWQGLIRREMREDHSWGPSAQAYEKLYERLVPQRVTGQSG